jgi:hypothetical protein
MLPLGDWLAPSENDRSDPTNKPLPRPVVRYQHFIPQGEGLMQEFLNLCVQPGGYWLPVLILGMMLCLTLVAMVAVGEWGKLRRAKLQASLTQAMLQRGMSAVEILQMLAASRDFESMPRQPAPSRSSETADCTG